MPAEDEYAREVVRSVENMSRQLVEFRQDISRAMYPLYPRIVEIEKQLEAEAKERPARQQVLDSKLSQQDKVLQNQNKVLQDQDKVLQRILKRQLWGRVLEGAIIIIGMAVMYWWLR